MIKCILICYIIIKEVIKKAFTLFIVTFLVFAFLSLDINFKNAYFNSKNTNIINSYFNWANDFIHFNFRVQPNSGQENSEILANSGRKTALLVFGAMLFSFIFSLFLLFTYFFLEAYKNILKRFIKIVEIISSFHVLVFSIFLYIIYMRLVGSPITGTIYEKIGMIVILGLGSGNFMDLFLTLKESFEKILSKDYVRAAKSRGESILNHILKESSINIISIFSAKIPIIISATIIIEKIFIYQGFCYYIFDSFKNNNLYLLMAITTFLGVFVLFFNFVSNVFQKLMDPRAT